MTDLRLENRPQWVNKAAESESLAFSFDLKEVIERGGILVALKIYIAPTASKIGTWGI